MLSVVGVFFPVSYCAYDALAMFKIFATSSCVRFLFNLSILKMSLVFILSPLFSVITIELYHIFFGL